MTEGLPAALIERLTTLATVESLLICSDFDCTLSPLVLRPSDAVFLPGIKFLLDKLSTLNSTSVAIVSGRALADLAQLTGLTSPVILVGSHGVELPFGASVTMTEQQSQQLQELRVTLDAMLAGLDGVTLEYKPVSVTVHVRQASRSLADRITRTLLDGPGQWSDVHCQLGKEVIELSVVPLNKGLAIERLRLRGGDGTRVIYFGDDVTDEQAFDILSPLDLGIKVGSGPTSAECCVDSPVEVRSLLNLLTSLRFSHFNPLPVG